MTKVDTFAEKHYSFKEEQWNIWTHAFGLGLFVIGLLLLLVKAVALHSPLIFIAFLVYGAGQLTMYLASTLYHSATKPAIRKKLNVFDHMAIFLSIAGSYTPITLITMADHWGVPILIAVWLIAAGGIILKYFFIGRYSKLSTTLYVLMGWVIVVAVKPLIECMALPGLIWLLAGGVAYTVGAALYQLKQMKYNHAIFHVFVLIGSICHYIVIYNYCLN